MSDLTGDLLTPVVGWYARAARDLPWRAPDADPWAVLVSEVMLQQTPVARVLPAYDAWLRRWPTPSALAADEPGEAIRMWGRLGYPRRALRLHACAVAICERFGGTVPGDVDDLLTLPGVGTYTARAVAAFAFGRRCPVVDTNVRRVVARVVDGVDDPGPSARDLAAVEALLPDDGAPLFSVALMELGALVCTARTPRCAECPLQTSCRWRAAGRLAAARRRPVQAFAGTDRQVRGLLLGVVRTATAPVPWATLEAVWGDAVQRERALAGLVTDGLLVPRADGTFTLP